jgi:hypothetical protein
MKCEADQTKPYSKGEYNKIDDQEQWIRLSEGCPHYHSYCRESFENSIKVFEIPDLKRNKVKILDMNLLCHKEALEIIKELGRRKANNKVIYYELICGIDWRFLNQEIASALRQSRFKNIRLAWDLGFEDQYKIKDSIKLLLNSGYDPKEITIFIICNWEIPYEVNLRKLDLCKIWNVKIADCWFDNQLSPNIKPIYWNEDQIKDFRSKVRKHNQLVNFGIDPEFKQSIIRR